jgi:hypothetical protein
MDWLAGPNNYYHHFDYRYRDVLPNANFLNDYNYFHILNQPFPKQNIIYLCSCLKIPTDRNRDALNYCAYLSEIYRLILLDSVVKLPPHRPEMVDHEEEEVYLTDD